MCRSFKCFSAASASSAVKAFLIAPIIRELEIDTEIAALEEGQHDPERGQLTTLEQVKAELGIT